MPVGKTSGLTAVKRELLGTIVVGLGIFPLMQTCALAEPKGELVFLQWLSGSDLEIIHQLERAFQKNYSGVHISEVPVTRTGDARGGLRIALMSGERADLMVNAWPSFRKELVDNNLLLPLDTAYDAMKWNDRFEPAWRQLGSNGENLYGVTYTYGDRSGLWYNADTFKKAGISPPKDWAGLIDSFGRLNSAGVVPFVIPAKVWAHAEIFETLLLREGGSDLSRRLSAHQIPWTDERVKTALREWRDLLAAKCCSDVSTMLGMEWDNAADLVLQSGAGGFFQMGMWVNSRAANVYKLDPSRYGVFQFPATGQGHDNAASVDTKEFVELSGGANQEAAEAFIDFATSAEGADIVARGGLASPSKLVDKKLYSPVVEASNALVAGGDTAFVLGDTLPGDLVDEYRIQLQRFLQDPSDENIDRITADIEEKAKGLY
jgi:ABC-type glycerol-3-phosphate transport system substrate-binding protein